MYHLLNYAKTFKYIKSSIFDVFEHFGVKKLLFFNFYFSKFFKNTRLLSSK